MLADVLEIVIKLAYLQGTLVKLLLLIRKQVKGVSSRVLIPIVRQLVINVADIFRRVYPTSIHRNRHAISNYSGNICVAVALRSDFWVTGVSVESMTSMKELADVAAHSLLNEKGTARMKLGILANIEHEIIKYHELITSKYSSIEFLLADDLALIFHG